MLLRDKEVTRSIINKRSILIIKNITHKRNVRVIKVMQDKTVT